MDDEEEVITVIKKKSEAPPPRRRPNKMVIPRRTPSIVIPEKKKVYITADKVTCVECPCFPKEDPYVKPKKLLPCQKTPPTLYELTAAVVDALNFPVAFTWSEEEVAEWMAKEVGLPQYKECIIKNHINGMRLLMFEDASNLPDTNIHNFNEIQKITEKVRELFSVDFILFARSVGLPSRKPLTHCTWFKSRTGPTWGIRQNWTRCDVLRWMKILMPEPIHINHWDLVWYQKPEFPKVKFARILKPKSEVYIPHYTPIAEVCKEYTVPRKFRLQTDIPESAQMIWMEHRPGSPMKKVLREKEEMAKEKKMMKKVKITIPKDSRLIPKRISLTGLTGKKLLLARRKMPKPKFLA